MQTIAINNVKNQRETAVTASSISQWFKKTEALLEFNRLGVVTALILLQISIAGFNVVIPAMAGASVWLMAPGIFFAFLSNSLAFAQVKMKVVLIGFGLSILINAITSIYFAMQLLSA